MKQRFVPTQKLHGLAVILLVFTALATVPSRESAAEDQRGPVDWSLVRGVEIASPDGWGEDYDPIMIDHRLALAKSMGFNAVKTWLVSDAYFANPSLTVKNLRAFVEAAKKHDLYVSFLIFHMGGGSSTPEEVGREIEWIPAEEALARAMPLIQEAAREARRPGWPIFFRGYVERYLRGTLVPFWGDPSQIFLQGSVTDPPYSHWGKEHWPRYEEYVKAIMTEFGQDENVILWDVMGEPYIIANYPWLFKLVGIPFDEDRVTAFLSHFCEYVANFSPKGAITVGSGGVESAERVERVAGEWTTLVSVHWFGPEPGVTKKVLTDVKALAEAKGKPALLTEFGNFVFHDSWTDDSRMLGTDEGQLQYYKDIMPVVEEAGMGWFIYRLIAGEGGFANSGLLYPNGMNRPAANYVRDRLAK